MNRGRPVFSQLIELLSRYEFDLCVKRYESKRSPIRFSYFDQFLALAFAQLTYRESLRDTEVCLAALGARTYHMGFRSRVTRSTLAYANETRDWRIWHDLAHVLITRARVLYAGEALAVEFENAAYALDSTTISLCFSLFPWAKYRSRERAIKMHTQLDLRGNIPSFIVISEGNMNDVRFLDNLVLEVGALYIMDRGYFDFERLYSFTIQSAFFITRLKTNIPYRRAEIFEQCRHGPVRCDAAITPLSRKAKKNYPQRMRLVQYFDIEQKKEFFFITNNFSLAAQSVADFYRARWQIELFFKWIKQHLRIKAFFGTSENAVKSQIWIAVATYVLVAILKKELQLPHSLHTILQVLGVCATHKMPILSAFYDIPDEILPAQTNNQLELFKMFIGQ